MQLLWKQKLFFNLNCHWFYDIFSVVVAPIILYMTVYMLGVCRLNVYFFLFALLVETICPPVRMSLVPSWAEGLQWSSIVGFHVWVRSYDSCVHCLFCLIDVEVKIVMSTSFFHISLQYKFVIFLQCCFELKISARVYFYTSTNNSAPWKFCKTSLLKWIIYWKCLTFIF